MLNDSGKREEFSTGAVRDTQEGKGRCDLLPLDCLPRKYANDPVILMLDQFKKTGNFKFIEDARECFIAKYFPDVETSVLELSIHYQEGAAKYGDNNWQKGLPTSRYISSAIRHYMQFRKGDKKEPHHRSFVWNLTAIIWTCKHLPEMNDYAAHIRVSDTRQCGKTFLQALQAEFKHLNNNLTANIILPPANAQSIQQAIEKDLENKVNNLKPNPKYEAYILMHMPNQPKLSDYRKDNGSI